MRTCSIICSLVLLCSTIAKGQTAVESEPVPFGDNYLLTEIQSNQPISFTQNEFSGGAPFGAFSFRHTMDEQWMMGVGLTFKLLRSRAQDGESLAIWTIHHEALRVIRIYHPTYFLVGTRILYMVPAQNHTLPLKRNEDFETEIGGAVTASLVHVLNNKNGISLRIDRWRGTRTQIFHGTEVALGYMYNLD